MGGPREAGYDGLSEKALPTLEAGSAAGLMLSKITSSARS